MKTLRYKRRYAYEILAVDNVDLIPGKVLEPKGEKLEVQGRANGPVRHVNVAVRRHHHLLELWWELVTVPRHHDLERRRAKKQVRLTHH